MNIGKIIAISGPVVDVCFEHGEKLPKAVFFSSSPSPSYVPAQYCDDSTDSFRKQVGLSNPASALAPFKPLCLNRPTNLQWKIDTDWIDQHTCCILRKKSKYFFRFHHGRTEF